MYSRNLVDERARSIIECHVNKTYNRQPHAQAWRNLPEIPTADEILPSNPEAGPTKWNDYQIDTPVDPNLPKNIVDGPWGSRDAYLEAHYRILRKDTVLPLQRSVEAFRRNQVTLDDRETCLYTDVTFKGVLATRQGLAFRVEFALAQLSKRINWVNSKRLLPGSIVALSPEKDAFTRICKVAIVAARPLDGVIQNPPSIDLFFGDINDIGFDPMEKLIMIEARSGFFEASRHMLVAIQKLMCESFHLENHMVYLDRDVNPPLFLEQNPYLDLSVLENPLVVSQPIEPNEALQNINILEGFPQLANTGMDKSQQKACELMLTKRVAIVQGPPGTGKTFVSVAALKTLLLSLSPDDPPIIVAAQTNHALDQLINHVLSFEKKVVRLGSRCNKANTEIMSRTLFELQTANPSLKGVKSYGSRMGAIKRELDSRTTAIKTILLPLTDGRILSSDTLAGNGIISETQAASLKEDGWQDDNVENDVQTWLQEVVRIPSTPVLNMGLEEGEAEDEEEGGYAHIAEVGVDTPEGAESQEATEGLAGEWIPFRRQYTGRTTPIATQKLKKLLAKKDLYDIPKQYRGTVYRNWEDQLHQKMLGELKEHAKEYNATLDLLRITKDCANVSLIRALNTKLIGATTTGLGKYRSFLSALQPRILLIEEAAETLEGTVITGMFDSLQQLILVGDHKQLQANCSIPELGLEPYNLNVSMFERLVNNGLPFVMLNRQRRMNPEIRELLTIENPGTPFYKDLYDHPSVIGRPSIKGMGPLSTSWISHNWPETRNADGSWLNVDEAEMVALFYNYLVLNGHEQSNITILTFYQAQRKQLLKQLRQVPNLKGHSQQFKVCTVDSYQGEENDIIILSLVRCNERMGVGFLASRNRLVVALSRARRGLYLFGSSITLRCGEPLSSDHSFEHSFVRPLLWTPIIEKMRDQGRFKLDAGLRITCENHGNVSHIYKPADWLCNAGGCQRKCLARLTCGHDCPYNCHTFEHVDIICPAPCIHILACNHKCSASCGEVCFCELCKQDNQNLRDMNTLSNSLNDTAFSDVGVWEHQSSPIEWKNFDPELSDREAREAMASLAITSNSNSTQVAFQETWKQTKAHQGGYRVSTIDVHRSQQGLVLPSSQGRDLLIDFDEKVEGPVSVYLALDECCPKRSNRVEPTKQQGTTSAAALCLMNLHGELQPQTGLNLSRSSENLIDL